MRRFASRLRRLSRARLTLAVVAVSAVAATTALAAMPARAAVGTQIISGASGKCLDVLGGLTAPGTAVNIWTCNAGANQTWDVTAAGELRVYGNMCLDVFNKGTAPGTKVVIWTCNGGDNQQWRLNADGSIVGVGSNLCADVFGEGITDGTLVDVWTCTGRANQKWTRSGSTTSDTIAPTEPGNARVSNLTCRTVTFSWNASTDAVGVQFYDIYHDGQHMTSVSGTTLSTSLPVVAGANWGLYVNARDAAGNVSQASDTVDIEVPQCTADREAPTPPGQLSATVSGTSVALRWTASSDNTAVTAYDVYRAAALVGTVSGNPAATAFTDSALAANTRYEYHVIGRDAQGNASARSNTAVAQTGGGCASAICTVRQVTTDNDIPWGLTTLPDGNIMYARRDAHDIIHLNPTTGAKINMGQVPNVQSTAGEGGLLGIEIAPSFTSDRWLYIMHTSPTDNRIVRMRVNASNRLTGSPQVLVSGIRRNKFHDGGRLRWGPDGKLYASTGDAQNGAYAQDRNNLAGKILRMNPDGSVPSDNPFGNLVWSYGHRNPQGIAFDSQGRLWEQEFGNSVMDETNLIVKGGNYGWPSCEGTSGNCGGYVAPKRTYPTASGSCSGLTVVRNVVYIACTRGARMYRAEISGTNLTNVTQHFNGTYGRLRTVEPAPGGGLWLTTTTTGDKDSTPNNSNERIFRVAVGN